MRVSKRGKKYPLQVIIKGFAIIKLIAIINHALTAHNNGSLQRLPITEYKVQITVF